MIPVFLLGADEIIVAPVLNVDLLENQLSADYDIHAALLIFVKSQCASRHSQTTVAVDDVLELRRPA